MALNDFEINTKTANSSADIYNYITGSGVGKYIDSASVGQPPVSSGDQFYKIRHKLWRASNTFASPVSRYIHTNMAISSSVGSGEFSPMLSSSAYSVRTWIKMEYSSGSVANHFEDHNNYTDVVAGIYLKGDDFADFAGRASDNSADAGYRLVFTRDNIHTSIPNSANIAGRKLNLRLCGFNYSIDDIHCSGSGVDYEFGQWYGIRLDLWEKHDVIYDRKDILVAYVYNTGSSDWVEVGRMEILNDDLSNQGYVVWKDDPTGAFTGGERAGLYFFHQRNYNNEPLGEAEASIVDYYVDNIQAYAIPWDRNAT